MKIFAESENKYAFRSGLRPNESDRLFWHSVWIVEFLFTTRLNGVQVGYNVVWRELCCCESHAQGADQAKHAPHSSS